MRRSVRDFVADVLHRPTGQVKESSELGRWISVLCSLQATKSIVEIGTWRGNGTTRQIADGIAARDVSGASATCLEVDRAMATEAAGRYRGNSAISVIWGRLVGLEDVDDSDLTTEEQAWLAGDLVRMSEAPLVLDQIPARIDLLILDGGEFTTLAEFELLRDRVTQWVLLDDTRTRKCRAIVDEVRRPESEFAIVAESDERNGVMVLRRLPGASGLSD